MIGAIAGDIIGSRFEFGHHKNSKFFPLFTDECNFTDDTVCTIAIAEALLNTENLDDEQECKQNMIASLKKWCRAYNRQTTFGGKFTKWFQSEDEEPFNSFGNGSAMRVSAIPAMSYTISSTLQLAKWSAEITHNHPEGIKGAECAAGMIFLAREHDKKLLREFAERYYALVPLRKQTHVHIETCQDTMPKAIEAFLESRSYEDTIRNSIQLGGDTDTIATIAGSIAEVFYGVPEKIKSQVREYLPSTMLVIINKVEKYQKF